MARKLTVLSSTHDEYRMVAIVSTLKDYRLTFSLNQVLNVDFVRYDDFPFAFTGGDVMGMFPWFHYFDDHFSTSYYLMGNKQTGGLLLASVKHADYLLLIKDLVDDELLKSIIGRIRSIPQVITSMEVKLSGVKGVETLLEFNELHELEQKQEDKKRY